MDGHAVVDDDLGHRTSWTDASARCSRSRTPRLPRVAVPRPATHAARVAVTAPSDESSTASRTASASSAADERIAVADLTDVERRAEVHAPRREREPERTARDGRARESTGYPSAATRISVGGTPPPVRRHVTPSGRVARCPARSNAPRSPGYAPTLPSLRRRSLTTGQLDGADDAQPPAALLADRDRERRRLEHTQAAVGHEQCRARGREVLGTGDAHRASSGRRPAPRGPGAAGPRRRGRRRSGR